MEFSSNNSITHIGQASANNAAPNLDPAGVVKEVEQYGLKKVKKSFAKSFALAIFAGAFIAIAFVFYITVTTGAHGAPTGLIKLSGGIAFSLGLILVVMCGGELFTSTVLTTVAWAQGHFSTVKLIASWIRVYLGNLVGALTMLGLVITAQMYMNDGGEWGINAMKIAQHKLEHTWAQAFALGILCNLLVCLGTWMTFTTKDVMAKTFLLILPVAMFVSSGFEHSIANMFMVPLGLSIKALSDPAFYAAHGYVATDFAHLTISNFIFHNLIPVTLGNIVGGGVFVGIGYWLIAGESKEKQQPISTVKIASPSAEQFTTFGEALIMKAALNKLTVNDVMDKAPLVLNKDQNIYHALALLNEQQVDAAPVINDEQQLIGFISQQDILRLLWSEEYSVELEYTVSHAMQTEIMSVEANQPATALLEFMVVDKEKLFPVNQSGILTGQVYQNYDERLKAASANRPSIYPVVDNGKLCGVISRRQLTNLIVHEYAPRVEKMPNIEQVKAEQVA